MVKLAHAVGASGVLVGVHAIDQDLGIVGFNEEGVFGIDALRVRELFGLRAVSLQGFLLNVVKFSIQRQTLAFVDDWLRWRLSYPRILLGGKGFSPVFFINVVGGNLEHVEGNAHVFCILIARFCLHVLVKIVNFIRVVVTWHVVHFQRIITFRQALISLLSIFQLVVHYDEVPVTKTSLKS